MILRHWTYAQRVPKILREGIIHPTESNVSFTKAHAGPDVVWLLPPDVDPGAGEEHGLSLGKRTGWIDVDVPAIRWRDWEWTARMKPSWVESLVSAAGGDEFADQWYVWPAPIRAARFVGHGTIKEVA
jgi:hypothetical protein